MKVSIFCDVYRQLYSSYWQFPLFSKAGSMARPTGSNIFTIGSDFLYFVSAWLSTGSTDFHYWQLLIEFSPLVRCLLVVFHFTTGSNLLYLATG